MFPTRKGQNKKELWGREKKNHNDKMDHVPKPKVSPTQDNIAAFLMQFCFDKGNVNLNPEHFTRSLFDEWTLRF